MEANELLESKELREKLVAKVEVLDKVKKLLLIPNTDNATIKQISEYYEVEEGTIKMLVSRNRDELEEDGLQSLNGVKTKDFLVSNNLLPTNGNGFFEAEGIRFAYKSNLLFTRRSILRVGMLLQDSEVAKEVRTQLLNIEEQTSTETKLTDITEEQTLALSVGMAYASGDPDAIMIATTKMMDFKNRHIKELEQSKTKLESTNKALANGILEWEDRSRINFAVRKLSKYAHTGYGKIWNELYKQLKNKYHIDLQNRGKQPWLQYVKEDEWQCVIKSFSALCEYYETDVNKMFNDLKIEA